MEKLQVVHYASRMPVKNAHVIVGAQELVMLEAKLLSTRGIAITKQLQDWSSVALIALASSPILY